MSKTIMPLKKKLERRGVSVTAEDLKQLRQNGTPIYPKIKYPVIETVLIPESDKVFSGTVTAEQFNELKNGDCRLKCTLDMSSLGRESYTLYCMDITQIVDSSGKVTLCGMTDTNHGTLGEFSIKADGEDFKIEAILRRIGGKEVELSADKIEGANTAKSIRVDGTPWNMPDYDEALEEKADKTALNTLADTVQTKEDRSNKVNEWQAVPDHKHYPTEKLVKDAIQAITPNVRTVRTNMLYSQTKPATGELSIRVSDNNISIAGEIKLNEGFTELNPQEFVFMIKCSEIIPSAGDKIKVASNMTGNNRWYISNSYFETLEFEGEEYWKITITIVRYDTTASETDPPKVQFIGIGILD